MKIYGEENQEQISLESLKTLENLGEINCESNYQKISNNNQNFKILIKLINTLKPKILTA